MSILFVPEIIEAGRCGDFAPKLRRKRRDLFLAVRATLNRTS
jgi:hypothetical protein